MIRPQVGIDHNQLHAAGNGIHQPLLVAQTAAGVDQHRFFRPDQDIHPHVSHAVVVLIEQAIEVLPKLIDLYIRIHIIDLTGLVSLTEHLHIGPADGILGRPPLYAFRPGLAVNGIHLFSHFFFPTS